MVAATLVPHLVVGGVVGNVVLAITPRGSGGLGLAVAIWFVLGSFCGVLSFMRAAQALSANPQELPAQVDAATGTFVLLVSGTILAALALLSWYLWWRVHGSGDQLLVPVGGIPTLVFFGSVAASMLFMRHTFLPPRKA